MTVTPYDLPIDTGPTSSLTDPPHADLHNKTGLAVNDLGNRVATTETTLIALTAPNGPIDQARLAAHQWVVRGPLLVAETHKILIPLIWNITGRNVEFEGVKITVLTPADEEIKVDIVVGSTLTGPDHDHSGATQTSIFKTGKQPVIAAGQFFSLTVPPDDFQGNHPMNSYLAAFVEEVGSTTSPGRDLTIQINRSL